MKYNHFEYFEVLARKLKPIAHSETNKRYFRAFGLEDLYELSERISDISGFILIAIDGNESEITDNTADGLNDIPHYAFIIAGPTTSTDQTSITSTVDRCKTIVHQIIIRFRREMELFSPDELSQTIQTNGIGPLFDNYYGVMAGFTVQTPLDQRVDTSIWEE